jgi:hypothetical protein
MDGQYVQVISVDSSEWGQALPELLRVVDASAIADGAGIRRLLEAAELVESGQRLSPDDACSLFSKLVELQGQPPASSRIVAVVPTRQNPQAVSGQQCSQGRFTSVLVANQAGLNEPLPLEDVAKILQAVHSRTVG